VGATISVLVCAREAGDPQSGEGVTGRRRSRSAETAASGGSRSTPIHSRRARPRMRPPVPPLRKRVENGKAPRGDSQKKQGAHTPGPGWRPTGFRMRARAAEHSERVATPGRDRVPAFRTAQVVHPVVPAAPGAHMGPEPLGWRRNPTRSSHLVTRRRADPIEAVVAVDERSHRSPWSRQDGATRGRTRGRDRARTARSARVTPPHPVGRRA